MDRSDFIRVDDYMFNMKEIACVYKHSSYTIVIELKSGVIHKIVFNTETERNDEFERIDRIL